MAKTIDERYEEIRKLPYLREVWETADGLWHGRIVEEPLSRVLEPTRELALKALDDYLYGWIYSFEQQGAKPPEPLLARTYSGKVVLRVLDSVHRGAAVAAARRGVSLNRFLAAAIERAIAEDSAKPT